MHFQNVSGKLWFPLLEQVCKWLARIHIITECSHNSRGLTVYLRLPPSDQDSRTKSLFMKKPPSADLVMENASTHKIGDPERPEAKSAKEVWKRTTYVASIHSVQ